MNLATLTAIPKVGPASYSVHAPNGTPLAVIPPASSSPLIDFRWPRAVFVTGLLLTPGSGAILAAAHLELRIQDETQRDIFSDGQGGGFFTPALVMHGKGFKVFDLQRPVVDGDHWFVTIRNTFGAVTSITPFLQFFFEEPFLHPQVRRR